MAEIESRARRIVERMAMLLQGSLMARYADEACASAFLSSRLGGEGGQAFGTLPAGTDFARIIERHRAVGPSARRSGSSAGSDRGRGRLVQQVRRADRAGEAAGVMADLRGELRASDARKLKDLAVIPGDDRGGRRDGAARRGSRRCVPAQACRRTRGSGWRGGRRRGRARHAGCACTPQPGPGPRRRAGASGSRSGRLSRRSAARRSRGGVLRCAQGDEGVIGPMRVELLSAEAARSTPSHLAWAFSSATKSLIARA